MIQQLGCDTLEQLTFQNPESQERIAAVNSIYVDLEVVQLHEQKMKVLMLCIGTLTVESPEN